MIEIHHTLLVFVHILSSRWLSIYYWVVVGSAADDDHNAGSNQPAVFRDVCLQIGGGALSSWVVQSHDTPSNMASNLWTNTCKVVRFLYKNNYYYAWEKEQNLSITKTGRDPICRPSLEICNSQQLSLRPTRAEAVHTSVNKMISSLAPWTENILWPPRQTLIHKRVGSSRRKLVLKIETLPSALPLGSQGERPIVTTSY